MRPDWTIADEALDAARYFAVQQDDPVNPEEIKKTVGLVVKHVYRRDGSWFYRNMAGDECGPYRLSKDAVWDCAQDWGE